MLIILCFVCRISLKCNIPLLTADAKKITKLPSVAAIAALDLTPVPLWPGWTRCQDLPKAGGISNRAKLRERHL